MESYIGHVKTQQDAILLFEACRLGLLPRIRRRLSERERSQIRSGSVFIWDEQEAGMRRWTDGKSWSASRVSGSFLTYREMEGTRRSSSTDRLREESEQAAKRRKREDGESSSSSPSPSVVSSSDSSSLVHQHEEGYRYKPNGLYKQSFSIAVASGMKFHLISYYRKEDLVAGVLMRPSADPRFRDLSIPFSLYPESSPGMVLLPAMTNTPMNHIPVPPPPHGASMPLQQQQQPQQQQQQHSPHTYSHIPPQPHPQSHSQVPPQPHSQIHPQYSSLPPQPAYSYQSHPAHSYQPAVAGPAPASAPVPVPVPVPVPAPAPAHYQPQQQSSPYQTHPAHQPPPMGYTLSHSPYSVHYSPPPNTYTREYSHMAQQQQQPQHPPPQPSGPYADPSRSIPTTLPPPPTSATPSRGPQPYLGSPHNTPHDLPQLQPQRPSPPSQLTQLSSSASSSTTPANYYESPSASTSASSTTQLASSDTRQRAPVLPQIPPTRTQTQPTSPRPFANLKNGATVTLKSLRSGAAPSDDPNASTSGTSFPEDKRVLGVLDKALII